MAPVIAFFHHPSPRSPFNGVDYDAWARNLVSNARHFGHEVFHLSLTDGPDYGCEKIERDGDDKQIVYEIMLAQQAFSQTHSDVWYLDTDCVLTEPLPSLDCDLALTYRTNFYDCYNTGVVYGGVGAVDIFKTLFDVFPETLDPAPPFMADDARMWWGDQRVLREYFGELLPGDYQYGDCRLKILDGKIWNYSPAPGEEPEGKRIIHYKGNLKRQVAFAGNFP